VEVRRSFEVGKDSKQSVEPYTLVFLASNTVLIFAETPLTRFPCSSSMALRLPLRRFLF